MFMVSEMFSFAGSVESGTGVLSSLI